MRRFQGHVWEKESQAGKKGQGEQSIVRLKRSRRTTTGVLSNCGGPRMQTAFLPGQAHSVHRNSDKQVRHAGRHSTVPAWVTSCKPGAFPSSPLTIPPPQGTCTLPWGRGGGGGVLCTCQAAFPEHWCAECGHWEEERGGRHKSEGVPGWLGRSTACGTEAEGGGEG